MGKKTESTYYLACDITNMNGCMGAARGFMVFEIVGLLKRDQVLCFGGIRILKHAFVEGTA